MPAPQSSRTSSDGTSRAQKPLPRWVTWGGAAIILALVLFLAGLLTGRSPVGDLRTQAQAAEQRAVAAESRAHALEAVALLYRAVLDLDARNFGIANEHVRAAVQALDEADAATFGIDAEAVAEVRASLAQMDIRVAEDLEPQRAALLEQARRLDAVVVRAR